MLCTVVAVAVAVAVAVVVVAAEDIRSDQVLI